MELRVSYPHAGQDEMSENFIVRAKRLSDGTVVQVMPDGSTRPLQDETNWEWVKAMTEEKVEAKALSDPDNPPLTDEELKRFKPSLP